MKRDEATAELGKSLVDVEFYFKTGIPKQLELAFTFSGEDAAPIQEAHRVLGQCKPFISDDLFKSSEEVLQTVVDQFNKFLDALRKVTGAGSDAKRQIATREANQQLQASLDIYRRKVHEPGKIIPKAISDPIAQYIAVSDAFSGQLSIAGNSISVPSMDITLSEVAKKLTKVMTATSMTLNQS